MASASPGTDRPGGSPPGGDPAGARASGRPGRFRRALAGLGIALGLTVVFVGAAGTAVVLHLDAAPTRRIVRRTTNLVLGSVFQGKIVVDEIDHVDLDGVDIRGAAVVDPRGGEVIRAAGLHAEADVLGLVIDAALGKGDLEVKIPYVRLEHGDVLIEPSATGRIGIEEALTPRPPKPPTTPPKPPTVPPRRVRVSMPKIEVGTAWVHGRLAPPRSLDADVSRLTGSVLAGPDGVAVDVEQTGLVDRAFLPATTSGSANYHLRVDKGVRMWTGFAGQLGQVMVMARGTLEDGHLSATAELPLVKPGELASVLPGSPVNEPLAARVDLDGDIPRFDVSARVAVHPSGATRGELLAEGRLDAERGRIELDLAAKEVDPRTFGGALPRASLAATGRLTTELAGPVPRLAIDARTEPAAIAGEPIPAADVHLVLDRGELSGRLHLDEPGMATDAAFVVVPGDGVRFDADTEIPTIAGAPRIAGPVRGSARVHVAGTVRGDDLDARVDGRVAGLEAPGSVHLGQGRVAGRVSGPLDALRVEATLSGSDVRAGGYGFESVHARASGPVLAPRISAELSDPARGRLKASGQLDPRAGAVRGIAVSLRRDDDVVEGKIASIGARGGGVAIQGVELSGAALGNAKGDLHVQGGEITGKLHGEGVDLERLTRLVGLPPAKGIANVDVDLERGKRGRNGAVKLELEEGEAWLLRGLSAHATATFKDDEVELDALVRMIARDDGDKTGEDVCDGTIAQVRLEGGKGVLSGPLLAPATWRDLTGRVKVVADDWDLRCLARKLLVVPAVLSDAHGRLTTRFEASRAPGQRFPSVKDLFVRTRGLELAGDQQIGPERPEGDEDRPRRPHEPEAVDGWESRHVDLQVRGDLDGATGKAAVKVTLFDGQLLGDIDVSTTLDLPRLADEKTRRASFLASPIAGSVSLFRRSVASLSTLPTFLRDRLPPISGELRADGYLDGTVVRPAVLMRLQGWNLAQATAWYDPSPRAFSLPIDVDAVASYDTERGMLSATASKDGAVIASASAQVEADLHRLLAPRAPGTRAPWTGGFTARLSEVPIGDLPLLADHDVAGHLSGSIAMGGLNEAPTLNARLALPDLSIGSELFFERGDLSLDVVKVPGGGDRAIARAEFVSQAGGRFDAAAYAGVNWDDVIIPGVEDDKPADVYAKADHLRLIALYPFVSGVLSKLDGYLDGELRFGWSRLDDADEGSVVAKLEVTQGVFHIPQLGQELRNATAQIIADGSGGIRLDNLSADGSSGQITGWGMARLDGLKFRDAAGDFQIKKGQEIPVTLEGVPVGRARGNFHVEAGRTDVKLDAKHKLTQVDLRLGVKEFDLELPAASSRNVQPLDDNAEIAVSHPMGAPKEGRGEDALRWVLKVDLAPAHVHTASPSGTDIDLYVSGVPGAEPTIRLADKAEMTGDLQLVENGTFEIYGKVFRIDRGLVRLRPEDASNPYVNVTAHWDSGDDAQIFVDYVGVLKPPTPDKLKFRSEKGLSQQEILATLLFGADRTGDTTSGSRTGDQAAGGIAGTAVGGLASAQFNTLLQGISPLRGFSTRVGTSQTGAVQTSVSYDVAENFSASATYEGAPQSQPQSGTAAGATQRTGRAEVSIDWRFRPNWSVRGSAGRDSYDQGTYGIDLLWQYRY